MIVVVALVGSGRVGMIGAGREATGGALRSWFLPSPLTRPTDLLTTATTRCAVLSECQPSPHRRRLPRRCPKCYAVPPVPHHHHLRPSAATRRRRPLCLPSWLGHDEHAGSPTGRPAPPKPMPPSGSPLSPILLFLVPPQPLSPAASRLHQPSTPRRSLMRSTRCPSPPRLG